MLHINKVTNYHVEHELKRIREYIVIAFYLDVLMLCMVLLSQPTVEVSGNHIVEVKKVAITFDDGPHPIYTKELLEGLSKRNVKATFFVTGSHASENKELILQMKADGHLIGNHTYSHMGLTNQNREVFIEELKKTSSVIREITEEGTVYVRPPYGVWEDALEDELDMIPVLWTVDPLDWCRSDVEGIVQSVLHQVQEEDVILMHDTFPSSVEATFIIVDTLLEQGYRFVTVEELLVD
ncbi:MAG: polysaccharide deacetylase family protein [Eubacteriales bacterium]